MASLKSITVEIKTHINAKQIKVYGLRLKIGMFFLGIAARCLGEEVEVFTEAK